MLVILPNEDARAQLDRDDIMHDAKEIAQAVAQLVPQALWRELADELIGYLAYRPERKTGA